MYGSVVMLNADYQPLGIISWQKAVKLIAKKKVEVVKATTRVIYNFERTFSIVVPSIIRLIKYIRALWKTKVPFNKRNLSIRDGHTCAYCGKKLASGMSIDHVLPVSKGGKSTFDNTVAACVPCNNKKDDKSCKEAGMYPRWKPFTPTISQFLMLQIKHAGLDATMKELGL
jgi:5-methylcytosine-specific restriction endonuclease McrA